MWRAGANSCEREFGGHLHRHPTLLRSFGWQATPVRGGQTAEAPKERRVFLPPEALAQGGHSTRRGGSDVWYVYFLELSNGDIYVGFTSHLRARVEAHGQGQIASTRPYLPVKLRSYVAVETEIRARDLERYFKSGSGKAVAIKRFL